MNGDFCYKDKKAVGLFYLYDGNPYNIKMIFSHWEVSHATSFH